MPQNWSATFISQSSEDDCEKDENVETFSIPTSDKMHNGLPIKAEWEMFLWPRSTLNKYG